MTAGARAGGRAGGDTDVSRRDFVSAGVGLSAALLGLPVTSRLGIQLYTLRDTLKLDFEGTLRALAQIGYEEVEFAGLHGHPPAEVRDLLRRFDLAAPAGHYGVSAITETLPQTIEEAHLLGHRYVVVPWLPEEDRTADGYARTADAFNLAGEQLSRAELMLGYHNHDFEFRPLLADRTGYDILLERTDPRLVCYELDLFWIRKGGRNPLDYFARHRGRFRLVHIKDMAADGAMVDVGQGVIDWPRLLPVARKAGVEHFLAEHDSAADPLGFARASHRYLAKLSI